MPDSFSVLPAPPTPEQAAASLLCGSGQLREHRASTDEHDLTAQRQRLAELGVSEERIYLDHGLTGTTRARPGLDQALAAVRTGDTLVRNGGR